MRVMAELCDSRVLDGSGLGEPGEDDRVVTTVTEHQLTALITAKGCSARITDAVAKAVDACGSDDAPIEWKIMGTTALFVHE
ncbi:hypothetical protein Aduo_016084 [Ancylostoma duodenale]